MTLSVERFCWTRRVQQRWTRGRRSCLLLVVLASSCTGPPAAARKSSSPTNPPSRTSLRGATEDEADEAHRGLGGSEVRELREQSLQPPGARREVGSDGAVKDLKEPSREDEDKDKQDELGLRTQTEAAGDGQSFLQQESSDIDDVLTITVCQAGKPISPDAWAGVGCSFARPSAYTYEQNSAQGPKSPLCDAWPLYGTQNLKDAADDLGAAAPGTKWSYNIKYRPEHHSTIRLDWPNGGKDSTKHYAEPGAGQQGRVKTNGICISDVRTTSKVLSRVPFWLKEDCSNEEGVPNSMPNQPSTVDYFFPIDKSRLECGKRGPAREWGPHLVHQRVLAVKTCDWSPKVWDKDVTLRATLKFKPEAGAPDIETVLPLPSGGGGVYTSVVVDSTGAISEDNLVAVTLALGNGFLDQENYLGAEVDKNRVCINRIVYEAGVLMEGGPTVGDWLVVSWVARPTLSTGAPNPFHQSHLIDEHFSGQPSHPTLFTWNTNAHYFDSMKVQPPQQKPDSSLQRKPQEATAAEWCTGVRQSDDGLDDTAPITTTSAAPAPAPAARHLAEKHKTVDKAVEVVDEDDSLSDCC